MIIMDIDLSPLTNIFSRVSDIKDNLTSTDTNKPLSANQGKELKTQIDEKINSSDFDTVTATITYTDDTTEEVQLYIVSGDQVFDNAQMVEIGGKEVKSIVLQNGGVLYEKEPLILCFKGTEFKKSYYNKPSIFFEGTNILIDWGDGIIEEYYWDNKEMISTKYIIEGNLIE